MTTVHSRSDFVPYQDQGFRLACVGAMLALSAAGTLPGLAVAADGPGAPPAPLAITTAPPLHPNPLLTSPPAGAPVAGGAVAGGAVAASLSSTALPAAAPVTASTSVTQDSVPWVLVAEAHPWPLHYREPQQANTLFLDIPEEQEARLMLPGKAADGADRARFSVSKYISDAIGLAAQGRGRQIDALEAWLTQTETQARQLSTDPWQRYQFSLESRREIDNFRASITTQGQPSLVRMTNEVKAIFARISPIVNLMPTYELRTAWYAVMVQLKEGLALYQAQMSAGDTQLLNRIDTYLATHPVVVRPAGSPPAERTVGSPRVTPEAKLTPATMSIQAPSKEIAKPVQAPETGSFGGLIVAGGMLAGIIGIFLKVRRKFAGPAPVKTEPT